MKLSPVRHLQKGFTLIELLVVIGILGILAAALVATIDPFEQLNKAQDANSKNTAVEFLNANIRYYTTHSALPWNAAGAGCNAAASPAGVNLNVSTFKTCLDALITEGELKPAFTTATGILTTLVVNEAGGNITMCYSPKSKSQSRDVNTKYLSTGVTSAAVGCTGGPTNTVPAGAACFWCTQ